MRLWRWLVILAPTLIGTGLSAFFFLVYNPSHNHIVYLRSDLGILTFFAGVLLSFFFALVVVLQVRMERSVLKASKTAAEERRRFLLRLDHELKNPLTALRAGIANLRESPSDRPLHETIASLQAQTLRISRLTSDLRKLAEIEVRQFECLPVDIPTLLREAFQMASEHPGSSSRTLNLNLPQAPWPLPTIQGDADLLLLAIHNLLENALKFSSPGDTLELRAFELGQQIVIEVADTGPGIPEDEQPLVWEELYRGRSSRGIPGSGMGLTLVRAIIERHNGSVSLRSRLDQGTVFTLRLPTN
ncbi:MAG TPA: HAMP domain-containing sensor histidine kinase [Anaerolineales bacterium]|nr:HAMP domain-containing sensor histidine kinase [Anaerolineales bacterium]